MRLTPPRRPCGSRSNGKASCCMVQCTSENMPRVAHLCCVERPGWCQTHRCFVNTPPFYSRRGADCRAGVAFGERSTPAHQKQHTAHTHRQKAGRWLLVVGAAFTAHRRVARPRCVGRPRPCKRTTILLYKTPHASKKKSRLRRALAWPPSAGVCCPSYTTHTRARVPANQQKAAGVGFSARPLGTRTREPRADGRVVYGVLAWPCAHARPFPLLISLCPVGPRSARGVFRG